MTPRELEAGYWAAKLEEDGYNKSWMQERMESLKRTKSEDAPRTLRELLKGHWLFGIECHHEAKTDQAVCACGLKFPERENVGKAVEDWAEHLLAATAPVKDARPTLVSESTSRMLDEADIATAPAPKDARPTERKWICELCKHQHILINVCGVGGCECVHKYIMSVPAEDAPTLRERVDYAAERWLKVNANHYSAELVASLQQELHFALAVPPESGTGLRELLIEHTPRLDGLTSICTCGLKSQHEDWNFAIHQMEWAKHVAALAEAAPDTPSAERQETK